MKRTITLLLSILCLAACVDSVEKGLEPDYPSAERPFGSHLFKLSIWGKDAFAESTNTKSAYSVDVDNINNVNAFVYGPDGNIVNTDRALTYFSSSQFGLMFGEDDGLLSYTVVFFANVGYITPPSTLAEISALSYSISSYKDLADGVPAAGVLYNYVPNSETKDFQIKRLVGQYNISLKDGGAHLSYEVQSARIVNSAKTVYPFADVLGELDGTNGKFSGKATASDEIISEGDYLSKSDIATLNKGGTVSVYALENCQGILASGASQTYPDEKKQYRKTPSTNAELCTYIELTAEVHTVTKIYSDCTYRFYLGGDAFSDYSIRRNTKYDWIYTMYNWGDEDSIEDVDWFVEPGSYQVKETNIWFSSTPGGALEDAIDSCYLAHFVTTTIYARTDNPLLDLEITKGDAGSVSMSVSDYNETTKKIVLETTQGQTDTEQYWDPALAWDDQPVIHCPLKAGSGTELVDASADLDARVIYTPLGVSIGSSSLDCSTGLSDNYNIAVNISEPFALTFSSSGSACFDLTGFMYWQKSHLNSILTDETEYPRRNFSASSVAKTKYERDKFSRIEFGCETYIRQNLEDLENSNDKYWQEANLAGDHNNLGLKVFRMYDCTTTLGLKRGAAYRTSPTIFFFGASFNIGKTISGIQQAMYNSYTLKSGKTVKFRYISDTFDIAMETTYAKLRDRLTPCYRLSYPLNPRRTPFYDRSFTHCESQNSDGTRVWKYKDPSQCSGRDFGTDTYYGFRIADVENSHIKNVEEGNVDAINTAIAALNADKSAVETFCKNIAKVKYTTNYTVPTYGSHWGMTDKVNGTKGKVPARGVAYPDHQYVWDLRGCPASLSVEGSSQSSGSIFTMTTK